MLFFFYFDYGYDAVDTNESGKLAEAGTNRAWDLFQVVCILTAMYFVFETRNSHGCHLSVIIDKRRGQKIWVLPWMRDGDFPGTQSPQNTYDPLPATVNFILFSEGDD